MIEPITTHCERMTDQLRAISCLLYGYNRQTAAIEDAIWLLMGELSGIIAAQADDPALQPPAKCGSQNDD